MNDAELLRSLKESRDDLSALIEALERPDQRDGMTVLQRMRESYNGWPSSSGFDARTSPSATDADGELKPGHADPTGDAGIRQDRARDDRTSMDPDARGIHRFVHSLKDKIDRHTLRSANVIERDTTSKKADAGCTSCSRLKGHHGGPRWEPIYRGDTCRFCYEYRRATGNLPSKDDLQAHHDGKKIKRPA